MHIFHDESGVFAPSSDTGSFSLVTAYVLPELEYESIKTILLRFKERNGLPLDKEAKRKKLSGIDAPYFELLEELAEIDGILLAVGSDVSNNIDVEEDRLTRVEALLQFSERLGDAPRSDVLRKMSADITQLSPQNYTELICRVRLVWEVLQRSTGYFSQRRPESLSQFLWEYDYKELTKNHFEQTLESAAIDLMIPYAYEDPLQLIGGGDYSKMADTFQDVLVSSEYDTSTPQYQKFFKASTIFRSLRFVDSKGSEGVQIADLLANGLFGVLRDQNIQDRKKAAALLGKLMVRRRDKSILPTLRFAKSGDGKRTSEIASLMEIMADSARDVAHSRTPSQAPALMNAEKK